MLVVPAQRVDDLVMLLDAAQQLQGGGLVHVDAPAAQTGQALHAPAERERVQSSLKEITSWN